MSATVNLVNMRCVLFVLYVWSGGYVSVFIFCTQGPPNGMIRTFLIKKKVMVSKYHNC